MKIERKILFYISDLELYGICTATLRDDKKPTKDKIKLMNPDFQVQQYKVSIKKKKSLDCYYSLDLRINNQWYEGIILDEKYNY